MRRLATCTALAALVLAGCSSAVEVAVPDAGGSSACATAAESWPQTLAGQPVAETDPAAPAVRAWGDPAIIARCGVPALGPTTDSCAVVDGIDWVVEDLEDGSRVTTFGRDPAIEVLVPEDYGAPALLLPPLTEAAQDLPRNDLTCT